MKQPREGAETGMGRTIHDDDAYRQAEQLLNAPYVYGVLPIDVLADALRAAEARGRDAAREGERQAIEALEEIRNMILPCDVKLSPATTIRAGCTIQTLITALEQRDLDLGWTVSPRKI